MKNEFPTITAAAPEGEIVASWDAAITFDDAPVVSAKSAPNPSATLDSPDAQGGKKDPGQGQGAGKEDRGADGTPPRPRFTMSAYNGGPIRVGGYRFPVVIDGAGIKAASSNLPIYVGHAQTYGGIASQMEQLLGQTDSFNVNQATGEVGVAGVVTGESPLVKNAMAHAKNGFKFQASINAQPSKLDFVPENVQASVNGRTVTGPCVIARAVTCDHVALVPLGADSSTSANIAATAAKGIAMEFAAWITATFGLDAATLTPDQKKKFEAQFVTINASHDGGDKKDPPAVTATATIDTAGAITAHRAAFAAEDKRIADVRGAAKDHPDISAKAIGEGWSLERTELEVLRASRKAQESGTGAPAGITASNFIPKDGLNLAGTPADRGGRHIAAGGRLDNNLCAVIETAGLISAGYSADRLVKNPAYGQRTVEVADALMRKFGRGLGPMGIMRIAARFAGVELPENKFDAYQEISASFSTLSLPVILSNLMNKFLLDAYTQVDPDYADAPGAQSIAWQKFTKRGPLQDFKPHYRLRLTSNLEFVPLGATGEIQHGQVGEQSYSIKATTKARMFGLSREAIVNDDLSAMSSVPTHFGRGAGIAVAKAIYSYLLLALQSDGTTGFFSSSAITTPGNLMQPNLIATNGLSFTALEAAQSAMANQTDPYGQPFGQPAEILLCPPGIMNLAKQLYQSMELIPSLASGGNARGVAGKNTLAGLFRPVCSAWLKNLTAAQITAITGISTSNAGDNTSWYLLPGAQAAAYALEAGFLNGQEMPIVERNEAQFNQLGIEFRGFQDFGVSLAEPRSVVKSTA